MAMKTPGRCGASTAHPPRQCGQLRRRGLLALPLLALPVVARGQDFPNRPVRILVGFTPGGSIDIVARALVQKMTEELGQSVVVENRPGAGGAIAMEALARSAPDGHTLMVGTVGNLIVQPVVIRDLPYNVHTDVVPVTMTADIANTLVVHPSRPWRSLADLIAAAKARPGTLTWAHSGVGTSGFLSAFLMDRLAGTETTGVAYRGAAPMATDLVAGRIDFGFATTASVLPQIREGQLRPLAVSSPARQPWLPDTPTMAEAGLPNFQTANWTGLVAPRGTPRAAIDKLDAAMRVTLRDPATLEIFTRNALTPLPAGPDEFATLWARDRERWEPFVRATGATAN